MGILLTQQLELFTSEVPKPATGQTFRDPAVVDNKMLPIHRWVPWIAGYSASFVDDVLDTYIAIESQHNGSNQRVILDPFAGVGTTLVQAMLRGHRSIGFEINPYAALAARVKVRSPFLDLSALCHLTEQIQKKSASYRQPGPKARTKPPNAFRSRIPFFSHSIEQQVLYVLDFIADISDEDVRDLFRVAFGSVMVSFSNYTYEPSLGTRPGAGKPLIENIDAIAILTDKLHQMIKDIEWVQKNFHPPANLFNSHRIFNADFMASAEDALSDLPVDLMITSPPYMNNYHYVRNTRPQLYWLALIEDSSQVKHLEEKNLGKFWQTVRNEMPIKPIFSNPKLTHLIHKLRNIRENRGAYGGPGWANYVTSYFNDSSRFFRTLERVMRSGGIGVIVIGNSIIQGIEFKVEEFLAELAQENGLIVDDIQQIRHKRVGASITKSSVRRGKKSVAVLYESAVIVQKP